MFKSVFGAFLIHFMLLVSAGSAFQQDSGTGAAIQAPSQDKALKLHKALQRRPSTGYLFDRFYDSWLDTASIGNLEDFLNKQAESSSKTGDRLLLAFFYSKQGDDVQALQQFRTALKDDPGNAIVWYEKALVEARTLDFETALADLAKAKAANPKKEIGNKISQLQGRLYVRNRQNKEAIAVWTELVKNNPDDSLLVEDVIELQISEGLYDEAAKLSDQLIAKTKDPYQLVMRKLRKGDIVQRSGNRADALDIYGKTLQQVGNDTWLEREILGQIEDLFRREDDLVGLKEHFNKMIQANDKRLALRKSVAKLNVELGELEDAIKGYQEIANLTPGDRNNRETLIDVLARGNKIDLAIKQTDSLIGQYSDDAELLLKLARLHNQSDAENKSDNIAAAIEKFIAINEMSEYAFLRAARQFERFSDNDRAAATFEKCIAAFPESTTAKEAFADHLYKSEKKKEAIEIWTQLAEQSDRNNLIRVARQLGARQEHQAAYDALFKRYDAFKLSSTYLGQLCAEALYLKKYETAIPWALDRVRFAETAIELDGCIGQAIQLISKAEQEIKVIETLKSNQNLNVGSTCLLAELLEQAADQQEAEDVLQQSIARIQGDSKMDAKPKTEALQMLASQRVRLFSKRQDWTAAAEAAKQRIEMAGGRKSANVRQLIDLYARDGQLEATLPWIAEWKKISPGSLIPWFNESTILARLGRLEDSINVLRIASQKFPEDQDLHMKLGDHYLENGQFRDAERIFWRQYEDSKSLTDKLRWTERLANVAQRLGDMQPLIEKIEQRRRNNPQSIEPLLALAQVHRIDDNYEERRKALLEATRIQKDNLQLVLEIARLEESAGDWEKAIQTLRDAEKLDSSGRVKERIATLYIQYGETERGFGILLELAGGIKSGPRDVEKIVDAIVGSDDWQLAKDFLQSHVSRFPKDFRIQYLMAVINEELELVDEAITGFTELLSDQEEIRGLNKNNNSVFTSQLGFMETFLPAEFLELMQLGEAVSTTYSHRQVDGSFNPYAGFASSGTSAPNVTLPDSTSQCRLYALAHLKTIAEDKDEDGQENLVAAVKLAGVQNADVLFASNFSLENMYQGFEMLEENEDQPAILALAIYSGFNDNSLDADLAAKAHQIFEKNYPELAFFALLQAAAKDEKHHEKFDEFLTQELPFKPSYITVAAIARYLSDAPGFGAAQNSLTEDQTKHLSGKLLAWYPELSKSSQSTQFGPWMFPMIASTLHKSADPADFIGFLDQELANNTTQKQASNPYAQFGSYYGNPQVLIKPLSFPPTSFVSFPSNVAGTIGFEGSGNFNPFGIQDQDPEQWAERYGPAIEQAKNPMLKLLLNIKLVESDPNIVTDSEVEQYAGIQKQLDAMLKLPQPDPDAYLLAAGLASKLEQWERASDLLEKLRNLPMTRQMRQVVDSALVAIVTQGVATDLKSDENAKIVSSAKAAALRLRRGRLSAEARTELVSVFETLGLNKEAEKMESKLAQSGVASSAGSWFGGGYSAGSSSKSNKRIRELVSAGKNDAAMRLLATEFKNYASNALNLSSMGYSGYELDEFIRKVNSLDLGDQFVAHMNPKASKSINKIGLYGLASELFGEKEQAIEVYQGVLQNRKREDAIRLRLLRLEHEQGLDISHHFDQFDANSMTQVGQTIQQSFNGEEFKLADALSLVEGIAKYAKANSGTDKDFTWMVTFIDWSAGQLDTGDYTLLPSLYELKPEIIENVKNLGKRGRKRYDDLGQQRNQLHQSLCQNLLEFPATKTAAFTAMLRAKEAAGEPLDQFVSIAIDAITAIRPKKNNASVSSYLAQTQYYYSYGNNQSEQAPPRSPVEFLARHFGLMDASKREESLAAASAALDEAKKEKEVEQLKQLVSLYAADDEEFVTLANSYVEQTKKTRKRNAVVNSINAFSKVVEVWIDTRPHLNLDEFVLAAQTSSKPTVNSNGYVGQDSIVKYLAQLAKDGANERIHRILEKYSIHLVGEREQQVKKFAKYKEQINQGFYYSSGSRDKTQEYMQLLQQMGQNPDLIVHALKESHQIGLGDPGEQLSQAFAQQIIAYKDAGSLLEALSSTPFLNDLESFDPWADVDSPSNKSIWGSVVENMMYYEAACLEELEKELKKEPLTFGGEVLLKAARESGHRYGIGNIYNIVGNRLEKFNALPESQQKKIGMFVSNITSSSNFSYASRSVKLNKEGRKAKKLLLASLKESLSSDVDKLLAAKRINDLKIASHEFRDWSNRLLKDMDRSSSEAWIPVFKKTIELASKNPNQGYYGEGTSVAVSRISSLMNNDVDYDWLKIVHDLHQSDDKLDFSMQTSSHREIAEFLDKRSSAVSGKNSKKRRNRPATLNALYNDVGGQLADKDTSVLIPAFREMFARWDLDQHDPLIEWAASEVASGKYKELANDIFTALCIDKTYHDYNQYWEDYRKDDSLPSPTRAAELENYHQTLMELLDSSELTTKSKLAIVSTWIAGDWLMPEPCVWKCAQVINNAYDSKLTVDNYVQTGIFYLLNKLEPSTDFAAKTKPLADNWTKVNLRPNKRQQYGGYYNSYQYGNNEFSRMVQAIRLFSKLENRSAVERIVRRFPNEINNRNVVAALIENKFFVQARKICLKNWDNPDQIAYRENEYGKFNKQLDDKLPQFIELFGNDATKLLAETFIASLPDPDRREDKADKNQDQRLNELAERMKEVEFKNNTQLQIALILLSSGSQTSPHVGIRLREEAQKLKSIDLWDSNGSQEYTHNRNLLSSWLACEIRNDQADTVLREIEKLQQGKPKERGWSYDSMLRTVLEPLESAFHDKFSNSTSQQIEKLLPTLLKLSHPDFNEHVSGLSALAAVAHVVTDSTDEYKNWISEVKQEWEKREPESNGRKKKKTSEIFDDVDLDDSWKTLNGFFEDKKEFESRDKRIQVVQQLWRIAAENGFSIGSGHFRQGIKESCSSCREAKMGLDAIIDAGVLTVEEVVKIGPELAKTESVFGEIWRQVALEQLELNQLEEAAVSMEASIKNATKKMKQAKSNRKVEYAFILSKLNRDDEAKKQLKEVNESQLLADNVGRYKNLTNKYGQK